ncbi:MAG: alanine--tRNA ligase [Candidatus Omnitrophica bacterium]|nr:alanine--tRNA ligase [Candidatus Omnitrophota bacterium]
MTTSEIRRKYLNFFASKGHKVIASDSLVPKDDPTVLFTTAGMQQFKRQFLGDITDFRRAATAQKCLRTDDLDEVGKTDFHHTFFEMLGNFSFGDYFKREAIFWAWEFLTKELGIPSEKLWVSVNKEDKEAEQIWLKEVGIKDIKLFRLGDKSNFWPSNARLNGPNGPCGPCSEIFFDYEWETKGIKNAPKDPDDEMGRFCEIWNLVFTQFERKDGGVLEPLPNKNIDTGMGLERLTALMQGKHNNFDTTLFEPILKSIDQNVNAKLSLREKRVMADHIRAVTFGISDGVIPSNEGRGYIMKKLIITISDIAIRSGKHEPCVYKLIPSVIEAMADQYPEIKAKHKDIENLVKNIEAGYIKLRKERIPEFEKELVKIKEKGLAVNLAHKEVGVILFNFRDTYGLTLETMKEPLIKVFGNDSSFFSSVKNEFDHLMAEQQEKSRASSKMTGDVFTNNTLELNIPKTDFTGYKHFKTTDSILRIFKDNKPVHEIKQGDQAKIVLDRSPFYAESGGQIGDVGYISKGENILKITDTQKISEVFLHLGVVEKGKFEVGDLVAAEIDIDRRWAVMRNHTATHLLQAALREILGTHVQQQGSYVSDDRLRLDFTHHQAITRADLLKVERRVNEYILACDCVTKEFLPITEAKSTGALAFFAEKYGDVVRVISIGDYSKEFCGGTHLDSTGEIGLFKIVGESAIAQGIRRIEAKTGMDAVMFVEEQESTLDKLADLFKCPVTELADKTIAQSARVKDLEKQLEQFKFEAVKSGIDQIIQKGTQVKDSKIVVQVLEDVDINILRKLSDLIKQKVKSSVSILGARSVDSATILITVSDDLVKQGLNANELIKDAADLFSGKGGGRPQMAQAGSKDTKNLDRAVDAAYQITKKKIDDRKNS